MNSPQCVINNYYLADEKKLHEIEKKIDDLSTVAKANYRTLAQIKEFLFQPIIVITPGAPTDKEL